MLRKDLYDYVKNVFTMKFIEEEVNIPVEIVHAFFLLEQRFWNTLIASLQKNC